LFNGFQASAVVFTAYKLNLFSLLEKRKLSAKSLAKKLSLPLGSLTRFLKALVALKLLCFRGRKYFLTPSFSKYLLPQSRFFLGNFLSHRVNLWDDWQNLLKALKTNQPITFTRKHQQDYPSRLTIYLLAMKEIATLKAPLVASQINLKKYQTFLDLGGGLGEYSRIFRQRYPQLKITLFDLPQVIKKARKYLREQGINFQAGNCLVDNWGEKKYEVVFISNLLHLYSARENCRIISKCFQSLKKGGLIIIHDWIENLKNPTSCLFDLNMLVGTVNGRVYSRQEIKKWLQQANFKKIKFSLIDEQTSALFQGVKM
jgi:2-polyprenyl-3-methyl-5-hydroxy-6-metoxy-1,4-benzoquinol methylase